MKKYKITKEIADAYANVMIKRGAITKDDVAYNCEVRVVCVESILKYMKKFSCIAKEGCLISEKQREQFESAANTLYANVHPRKDKVVKKLESRLKYLQPEPEPSFVEIASKEFEAAKILLGGSEGVVFAISPKKIMRFCLDADCQIARQAHHLHAMLESLAKSMGLITEKGEMP